MSTTGWGSSSGSWRTSRNRCRSGGWPRTRVRLGAILERDRSLPPRELYDRTTGALERLARRLSGLTPDQLARRGLHPVRGELTAAQLVERFVVEHLAEHVRQLEALLGGPPTGS